MTLDVTDAPAGSHAVRFAENVACSAAVSGGWPSSMPRGLEAGPQTVDADGRGHLDTILEEATLKSDHTGTLLTRTLVVGPAEDPARGAATAAGAPIACAVVDEPRVSDAAPTGAAAPRIQPATAPSHPGSPATAASRR